MKYYSINANEMRANTYIFSREQLERYKCPGCGSIDIVEIMRNEKIGSEPLSVRLPDFFRTDDHVYIVSKKAKESIESFSRVNVHFFPLIKKEDYFAFLPDHLIYPPEKIRHSPAVDFAGEPFRAVYQNCLTCGKYPEIAFDAELYTVPDNITLAGLVFGKSGYILISSQELVAHIKREIKKEKLKGFSFSSRFANNK
jgi:predicted RNA-binding Zn-ribbon protein involved in translation (DUF1610 family)